ncbi:peptidase M48 [Halioglobus maricola]|uniref:Peptidase M48 n=1 Tax=Halioglobus maricola TaxID=2601894 RepID=A0A5P9NHP2_9GAMM|nr:M48 family metalloprotease [Halioglobus maricola]QFU74538.1 peptidase M48 [Halioglobus maricola]
MRLLSCCALLLSLSMAVQAADKYEKAHQEIVDAGQLYDDPELQQYIDRIGQRLVAHSDEPNGDFTFSVIDTDVINAFAAQGGYIYISRGLLPYLENEDELAGVLGHEIGHITGSHHSRRKTADVTSKIVATTTYILTGSGELADASSMYGAELISGFGREMELEADGLGAEYMYRAGYDPQALLQVIGVLKDHEQFQRTVARASGKPGGTYHGVYASHPRNDKRLQTVIGAAAELDDGSYIESPEIPGEFKQQMDGLVWGDSVQSARDENRFYHNKLEFTFEHPPGWTVQTGGQAVVARAPDQSASLTISLRRRDPSSTPQAVLEANAKGELSDGEPLEQAGLSGYTATASAGGTSRRLAVIDYRYSYLLQGEATDFAASDPALLDMIKSFRPTHPKEKPAGEARYLRYIRVPRGATVASIAAEMKIPHAEDQLRLINGLYPRGEPRTGDWFKVVQ